MSRPVASCTSRWLPASRPTGSCSTATTSRRPSCAPRSRPGSGVSPSTRPTSSNDSRLLCATGCRRRGCTYGSRPASRRIPTSTSRPAPRTRSSGSASTAARRWRPCSASSTGGVLAVRGRALSHRLAGVPPRLLRARGRQDGRPRPRDRGRSRCCGRRAQPRWRPRCALSVRRRVAHDRAVRDGGARGGRQGARRRGRALAPATAHGARTVDRRAGRHHALHRRHDQGDRRRADVRRGRRRHERQPAAGHLRRALRDVPARARPPIARPS